jgi:serine/threonine protein kinase
LIFYSIPQSPIDKYIFFKELPAMSQDVTSQGAEDLQGTSIGRKSLLDSNGAQDEQQRYHILKRIGEGGFGAVYRATDTFDNDRTVAIKVIHLSGLTAQQTIEATDSFNREVDLLTTLNHPQLPRIHDHFTDTDNWYMVMDFIEGETLDSVLEQRQKAGQGLLPQDKVLDIARQLCEVLEYLHSHEPTIIFRDLKPGNIMLTSRGQLYLIDFGIARHFKPGKSKDTIALGSPGYAAPEQYGKAQTSHLADIYSLGAVLHFLLSGNDPADDPFNFAPLPLELGKLGTLIMQMLSISPSQRPQSIATVRRIIDSSTGTLSSPTAQPAAKTPPPVTQHTAATLRKQRKMYARPARRKRKGRAHTLTRRQAITSLSVMGGLFLSGMGVAAWQLSQNHIHLSFGESATPKIVPEPPTPSPTPPPTFGHDKYIYGLHQAIVNTVAWSPDGKFVASGDEGTQQQLRIWQPHIMGQTIILPGDTSGINQVSWSPDGKRLASASNDQTVRIWDSTTGKQISAYREAAPVGSISWSPNGKNLAIACNNNQMLILDVPTGKSFITYNGHKGHGDANTSLPCVVAWHPNGQFVASGGHDATVQVWDTNTGKQYYIHNCTQPITSLAWSPDGTQLAICSNSICIWQPSNNNQVWNPGGNGYTCVTWSPDGKYLAYGQQNLVQIIYVATGEPFFPYRHTGIVRSVAWSPSDNLLASSLDDAVRIWSPGSSSSSPAATPNTTTIIQQY